VHELSCCYTYEKTTTQVQHESTTPQAVFKILSSKIVAPRAACRIDKGAITIAIRLLFDYRFDCALTNVAKLLKDSTRC